MKKDYFVIVDAGGNVYPGTFASTADHAKCRHIGIRYDCMNSTAPVPWWEDQWAFLEAGGDRCVECTVETKELVEVIIK